MRILGGSAFRLLAHPRTFAKGRLSQAAPFEAALSTVKLSGRSSAWAPLREDSERQMKEESMTEANNAIASKPIAGRLVLSVALVAICCAFAAGGTLAYFSADKTAHNVITSGNVSIELHEWADASKTTLFPLSGISGVTPGSTETKIVEVENTGTTSAWVRVKVGKSSSLTGADLSLITPIFDIVNWKEKDGYWYYGTELAPGEATKPLFESIAFSASIGDAYQGENINVTVSAQAVQTLKNGTSALTATGWPED